MGDSEIREVTKRKASLQRAGRIAIGLFFFGVGAFMSAAVIIGFDASHVGWQDYLLFALPVPWLVVSGIVFAYRPKPKMCGTAGGASSAGQSSVSIFSLAIGVAVFGGFLELLWASDWSEIVRSLSVTAGAVAILILLSRVFKKASRKRSAAADHTIL